MTYGIVAKTTTRYYAPFVNSSGGVSRKGYSTRRGAADQTISGQHTREPGGKQTAPDSTPAANSRIREIEREGWEG